MGEGRSAGPAPARAGVTPTRAVRRRAERAVTDHPVVFVLDQHGQPLQPCQPGRARKLLRCGPGGGAPPHPVRHPPDTTAPSPTPPLPACRSASTPAASTPASPSSPTRDGSRTGRYAIQLDHRGAAIRDKLSARSNHRRRGRRSRNLRYRAPRFFNRTKPKGWLAPSPATPRGHHHVVGDPAEPLGTRAPPSTSRRVAFDTHAMSAGRPLKGVEYQQGTLAGYEVRAVPAGKVGPHLRVLRRGRTRRCRSSTSTPVRAAAPTGSPT